MAKALVQDVNTGVFYWGEYASPTPEQLAIFQFQETTEDFQVIGNGDLQVLIPMNSLRVYPHVGSMPTAPIKIGRRTIHPDEIVNADYEASPAPST